MSSRPADGRPASARRPPPVVLLLLAALTVAVGPASVARSGVAAPAPAAVSSVDDAGRLSGSVDGRVPAGPARVDLRHASTGIAAVERPSLDAVLAGVALAVALLVLVARRSGKQRRPGLALPSGSARGPPASAV